MNKNILWLIGLLFAASFAMVSCGETDEAADPYTDWEGRNQAYIDSISNVARANLGNEVGQWKMIHTYKFRPADNGSNINVNDYVYCKILEKGTGRLLPIFTDFVSVHYRGKLIPLYDGQTKVFDQSYRGELNKDTAVPVGFSVSGVIEGWTTALQNMVIGDRWEVYIPYNLGYGSSGNTDIPANSTLIFDVALVDIITNR